MSFVQYREIFTASLSEINRHAQKQGAFRAKSKIFNGSAESTEVRSLPSSFFDCQNRGIEGILCVFQDLEMKTGEKYADRMCAAVGSAFPQRCVRPPAVHEAQTAGVS